MTAPTYSVTPIQTADEVRKVLVDLIRQIDEGKAVITHGALANWPNHAQIGIQVRGA